MSEPIIYPSRTDSLGLPLLFAGQAQKEFFINQAMSLVDAVIWHVVEGALDTPPQIRLTGHATGFSMGPPANGARWRILSPSGWAELGSSCRPAAECRPTIERTSAGISSMGLGSAQENRPFLRGA